jgi:hypothetical protein
MRRVSANPEIAAALCWSTAAKPRSPTKLKILVVPAFFVDLAREQNHIVPDKVQHRPRVINQSGGLGTQNHARE